MRYVVYDIETYSASHSRVIEEANNLAVAVTKSSDGEIKVWFEHDAAELASYLLTFAQIVGFNIKDFDNTVLDRYSPGALPNLNSRSVDILELVEAKLGHRINLESLARPTLKRSKAMNGMESIRLWNEGRKDLVIDYCKDDVEITEQLFKNILEERPLFYESIGEIRQVLVNAHTVKADPRDFNYRIIDNGVEVLIDKDNQEFFNAVQLASNTKELIYLTGKAGTGKTTFLKYLKNNLTKNTAVVAYTGVAAVNAGGQTIHSFFKINPEEPPFVPNDKRLRFKVDKYDPDKTNIFSHFQYTKARKEIFQSLEVLIIDEISMVRADIIDVIDKLLRAFCGRRGRERPFGGIQVILIGDVFQLPPIEGPEWNYLRRFYSSPFFFDAHAFIDTRFNYIELKRIYRQKENEFIDLLNRIRINAPTKPDLDHLNSKVRQITHSLFDENYIALCSTNDPADQINLMKLNELPGESIIYRGQVRGDFSHRSFPTELNLELKVGAQVMFLKNSKYVYNGKIGKIVRLEDGKVTAAVTNNLGEVSEIEVEKYTWHNVRFTVNKQTGQMEQEVLGSFTQFPIKLAWAITVHKSQGLTFEKVIININDFAPSGLVYVALSRCTSFSNLIIRHPIRRQQIKTDQRVIEFATNETPQTLIADKIQLGKADIFYKAANLAFKNNQPEIALKNFLNALEIRDDLDSPLFNRWYRCYHRRIEKNRPHLIKSIKEANGTISSAHRIRLLALIDDSGSEKLRLLSV